MSKIQKPAILLPGVAEDDPINIDAGLALRAAVRAVLPGRQQQKNLEASLTLARKAFYRTLLRRRRVRFKA